MHGRFRSGGASTRPFDAQRSGGSTVLCPPPGDISPDGGIAGSHGSGRMRLLHATRECPRKQYFDCQAGRRTAAEVGGDGLAARTRRDRHRGDPIGGHVQPCLGNAFFWRCRYQRLPGSISNCSLDAAREPSRGPFGVPGGERRRALQLFRGAVGGESAGVVQQSSQPLDRSDLCLVIPRAVCPLGHTLGSDLAATVARAVTTVVGVAFLPWGGLEFP